MLPLAPFRILPMEPLENLPMLPLVANCTYGTIGGNVGSTGITNDTVRSSPGTRCVLEQDTSTPLLSTA